ncbi:hypothetical protein B0T14DRAFT_306871 [Immersiella caudata]|uniref:Uncharacterized protein n=1 Tax=Immersiella caudata TaxID=314043 RepID=A0AA40BUQ8_9PEZI|nr:hypothetical protein B0T14DRAFT_306871 [Immersiella caudata]
MSKMHKDAPPPYTPAEKTSTKKTAGRSRPRSLWALSWSTADSESELQRSRVHFTSTSTRAAVRTGATTDIGAGTPGRSPAQAMSSMRPSLFPSHQRLGHLLPQALRAVSSRPVPQPQGHHQREGEPHMKV